MSVRTSLAWSFSQRFVQHIFNLIGSVIIARLLTPAEMGVFTLAMAAGFLIGAFRDFGVGSYLIREKDLNDLKIRTAFGIWITVSWTIGIVIYLARSYVSAAYGVSGISDVLLLVSINYFITPFGLPADTLMRREMRFKELHHITLTCGILSLCITTTLAFMGYSFMALAWGFLASTTTRTTLLLISRPDHIKMLPSLRYWRAVVRFGGLVTAQSFLITINTEGIKFIVGGFFNPAAVALIERANQIPVLMRESVCAPLANVLLPAFSNSLHKGESIGSPVTKLISGLTALIWPAFLTIGLLATPIVVFVFGQNWLIAGKILPFLLLSHAISSSLPYPSQILVPCGKVKLLFWLVLFSTVSSLMLAALGAWHSLMMCVYLQPVHATLFTLASYLCIRRYWQADISTILRNYAKAFVVAVLSAIPALTVLAVYGDHVPVAALFSVALSAPIIWLFAIYFLKHPLSEEITSVLSKLRLMWSREAG